MASRTLFARSSLAARCSAAARPTHASRSFRTTARLLETPPHVLPTTKKPVGAFRGGMTGFLLGSVTAGAGMYYYVMEEYKVSNELLTEDIYALQQAVQRIESYVKVLENKVSK